MTQLIFIRHGETHWNTEKRYMGHLNSPLTETGLKQAEAVAKRLQHINFDALYSSDLGRAVQTAQAIAEHTGKTLMTDVLLREQDMGLFQGLTRLEAAEKYPEQWQAYNNSKQPDYAEHNGESVQQLCARVQQIFEVYADKHEGQTAVIVTHGSLLKKLCRVVLGMPAENEQYFTCKNTSLNIFSQYSENWQLQTWGDIAHLE